MDIYFILWVNPVLSLIFFFFAQIIPTLAVTDPCKLGSAFC